MPQKSRDVRDASLRCKNVTNTFLMHLFSSSTRRIMCLFCAVLCYKHFRNASVSWYKYARNSRILLHKCIRFTSSIRLWMCLFRAVLRCRNATNTSLLRLFSYSTCPVMCLSRAVLPHKYFIHTPVLSRKYTAHPKFKRFVPQMHQFYVFCTPCNVLLSCRFTSQKWHKHAQEIVRYDSLRWKNVINTS